MFTPADNEGGKRQYQTLISLIVVLIVVLVFYVWVERLSVAVERSRIQYMLANVRSSIKIYELSVVVSEEEHRLSKYHHGNPMDFMMPPPEYLGEFDKPVDTLDGRWYFDAQRKELAYGVISPDSVSDGFEQLRYRLEYVDEIGAPASIGRLRLVSVPYVKANGIDE